MRSLLLSDNKIKATNTISSRFHRYKVCVNLTIRKIERRTLLESGPPGDKRIDAGPGKYDTTPAYHALTNQKFHNVYEVPFNNFANPRTRGILDPICACHAITIPKSLRFKGDDNGVPGPGTYWVST
nr:unnamed protein product [Callosobruchus chinensis]